MFARLRKACDNGDNALLSEIVETDETFLRGKEAHERESKKQHTDRGAVDQPLVFGVRERGGRAKAVTAANVDRETIEKHVEAWVTLGPDLYTDQHTAYGSVEGVRHTSMNHSPK
jgi:hypothetical protein